MKYKLIIILLGVMAILPAGAMEKPFYGDARPPRSIVIGKTPLFTIAPGDLRAARVVVARDAAPYTKYAASELSSYLGRILNVAVPVIHAPEPGVRHHFYVGISEFSKAAEIDDARLCRDAFIIATRGGDCYILGRDDAQANPRWDYGKGGIWGRMREKGSLFGVYDFLERFADCRFFFPGPMGTLVPEKASLAIPEIAIFDRPDYEFRRVSIYSGAWSDDGKAVKNSFDTVLSADRDRFYDYLRLQTRYVPNNHGLSSLGLVKRFGREHPEYFALRSDQRRYNHPDMAFPGQLCYSSPVMDEIYADAAALMSGKSAAERGIEPDGNGKCYWNPSGHQTPTADRPAIFGFMPQDAYTPCNCEKCKPHFATAQSTSDFMWGKVADLAARLRADHMEGYIAMMSYRPYDGVPSIALPDNILVMLATQGPWDPEPTQEKERAKIRAWNRKLGYRVWLWTYPGKFGTLAMPGIPDITPRAIGKYYAGLADDISGAYMNSATDKLLYHALNYYVFGKVAWNNATDQKQLLDDYYVRMYGAAAPAMRRIFERFETLWIEKIGGRTAFTELGPVSSPPSEAEVWNNVYSPAEMARLKSDFDQALNIASGPERERVAYMKAELLTPLLQAGDDYRVRNDAIAGFKTALNADGALLHLQPFKAGGTIVPTTVKVSQTAGRLTIVFQCAEPAMDKRVAVQRPSGDREIWKDDGIEIFLTAADQRQDYYQLLLNSAGSLTTLFHRAGTPRTIENRSINARTKITADMAGWQAEVTIPLAELGIRPDSDIAANFVRMRNVGTGEDAYTWSPFMEHGFQEPEHFGILAVRDPAAESIIPEGSFEVPQKSRVLIGNWVLINQNTPGTTVGVDTQTFIDGAQSLVLSAADPAFNGYFQIRQYLPMLKPSTRYELSFYLRTADITPLRPNGGAVVNIWDDNNRWFPQNWITGTQPWRRMRFEFTSGPQTNIGKSKAYIACCLYFATGKAWFDRIEMREIPPRP